MASCGPAAWRPKLRVLCFHGRQQSSAVFQHRLDRLLTKAASFAEFVFVDGPVELPLQPSERVNSRSWGLCEGDDPAGRDQVRSIIEKAWAELGPFDGVLGFSEGATVVHLCCQLPHASRPGLQFAILAGGPAPPKSKEDAIALPSLHFASQSDTCVSIKDSRALASKFKESVFVEHTGGHCFPQRPEDIQHVIKFLQARRDDVYPFSDSGQSMPLTEADENQQIPSAQLDELDALEAMFTESEVTRVKPAWPVRFATHIPGMEQSVLRFTLPPAYPEICGCRCEFFTERIDYLAHEQDLMEAIEAAREPVPFPSVLSMIQAAQVWTEEHAATLARVGVGRDVAADAEDDGAESGVDAWWLKEEEVDEAALKEAELQASKLIPDTSQNAGGTTWARECGASGFGRPWQFVVGLVGKPSAGKSTFFNAATRPDRPDREASMAAHPFTTIDPNVAPGWFATQCPSQQFGCDAQPEHGRVADGRRRYPLLLKDVAGLVPGAYCGRGRGNAFLNDLVEADSLIHVVDGSGRSDREGVDQGAGASKGNVGSDPLDEVGWVRREIHLWIFCNVRAKFDTVRKRARMGTVASRDATIDRLFSLLTGYHASKQLVTQVYEAAGFSLQNIAEKSGVLSWKEYDLHLLVACFLRVRFPITVALNKIDLPESAEHVPRVCAALGKSCIPVSAGTEWWLWDQQRHGRLSYLEGAGTDSVTLSADASSETKARWEQVSQTVLKPYGSTGVLAALSAAVLQRRPFFVCPVTEFSSYEGLLRANAAATGSKVVAAPLSTMVMLRPLSTVEEAFAALKHEQMLRGDFVRAEVLDSKASTGSGPVPRVLRRDEVLKTGNATERENVVVIRVLTNKKSTWQANH